MKHRTWLLLILLLFLAAGLRFYRLDAQSLWNDEGNSARLAERSLDLIVAGAKGDIHPPGYYLALHYWRVLFGHSELALRGLSAVCSVALVGLAFVLGRRLFDDETAGLIGAALTAVNPFQVYYAQETRMYALLALWAAASTWGLVDWIVGMGSSRRRRWALVVFVLAATAGLYTHYAFPFVWLAQNLAVGLVWVFAWRGTDASRRLWAWIAAQAAVIVLYLPWLPTAWRQVTSWSSEKQPYALLDALADVWRLLSFGRTIPTEVVTGGLVAVGALVFISLLPPVETDDDPRDGLPYGLRWGMLALLVIVPVGLILGLGLYKPAYEKFLLVAATPLAVLAGRGLASGWRVAGGAGVWGERGAAVGYRAVMLFLAAFVLFDTARSLHNLYFAPEYVRADYRAIAQHIASNGRPGDGIILNAPNQWEVFTYYYPDDTHVFPLARQRPLNPDITRAELERIIAEHRRLFAVFWGDAESDPERFIESWLEAHTYKAGETWYGDVRLAVYALPGEVSDTPAVRLDVRFGEAIRLDGYTLLTDAVAPGDIIQLALFWQTDEPITERYKVFVHLYAVSGELIAQTDTEPGATLRPTTTWAPGETVIDRYGVLVPLETPPGMYTLAVGLYDIANPAHRLPVVRGGAPVGDRLDLTSVKIE